MKNFLKFVAGRAVSFMAPFGGYKRSGIGRENRQEAIGCARLLAVHSAIPGPYIEVGSHERFTICITAVRIDTLRRRPAVVGRFIALPQTVVADNACDAQAIV
ncbi:MAG: hypothetical protein DRR15_19475 [Gammaproteobacteria bacterium]|nr:MAG: hypothetical protein DRR15_19475 [Gammaproteobacteria bacterium]